MALNPEQVEEKWGHFLKKRRDLKCSLGMFSNYSVTGNNSIVICVTYLYKYYM